MLLRMKLMWICVCFIVLLPTLVLTQCTNCFPPTCFNVNISPLFSNFSCLNGITQITGTLQIDAMEFDALPILNLTHVNTLLITNNINLSSLYGLSSLISVTNFIINNASSLTSLADLTNLRAINGSLVLQRVGVTSLSGLSRLERLVGPLRITENEYLINLDGLNAITTINSYIFIDANTNLLNIDGLAGVASLGGYLQITRNINLLHINGLSNLQVIALHVDIRNNNNLWNVNGLCGLRRFGGTTFEVMDNYRLIVNASCQILGVPISSYCACVGDDCPCCQSASSCPIGIASVQASQTTIDHQVDVQVPIFGYLFDDNNLTEIGSVFIRNNTLTEDDVLVVEPVDTSLYSDEALDRISQYRFISSFVSVRLESGVNKFNASDDVSIRLLCTYFNSSLNMYYINTTTNQWRKESAGRFESNATSNEFVFVEAFVSHFTDFSFLLPGADEEETEDGNGASEGNEDGAEGSSGLSSDALVGVIIGCVAFAILVIVGVIVAAIVVASIRNRREATDGVINFAKDDAQIGQVGITVHEEDPTL